MRGEGSRQQRSPECHFPPSCSQKPKVTGCLRECSGLSFFHSIIGSFLARLAQDPFKACSPLTSSKDLKERPAINASRSARRFAMQFIRVICNNLSGKVVTFEAIHESMLVLNHHERHRMGARAIFAVPSTFLPRVQPHAPLDSVQS